MVNSIEPVGAVDRIAKIKAAQSRARGAATDFRLAEREDIDPDEQRKKDSQEERKKEQQLAVSLLLESQSPEHASHQVSESLEELEHDMPTAMKHYHAMLTNMLFGDSSLVNGSMELRTFFSSTANTIRYGMGVSPEQLEALKVNPSQTVQTSFGWLNYNDITHFANLSARMTATGAFDLKRQAMALMERFALSSDEVRQSFFDHTTGFTTKA